MLSMLLRRFLLVVGALICAAGVMVPAFADDDIFAGTPAENTKAFSVTNAGNTHIVFSSTTRMLFARCVNDTAVQVFIVNQGDASTAAGVGPYCSTCDLGPTLPVVGDAFLRAGAAGPADVRCGFVESWPGAMGMSGGGGMSMGAADTRYLKLAADNDPLTGQLNAQQGTCATPGYGYASSTNVGTSYDGTNLNLCMNGAAVIQGSTSGISILSPVQSTSPPFALRTLQSSGTSSRWFSVGSTGTEELALYSTSSTIGASATRSILEFTNGGSVITGDGTAPFPAYAFVNENTMGMFRIASGRLGLGTAGVIGVDLNSSRFQVIPQVQVQNGTAAAPAITFTNDTSNNTGVFRVGEDDLGFSTNGTQRMDISTTAVTSTLPVLAPTGTAGAPAYSFSSSTNDGFYFEGAHITGITANGADAVTISATQVTTAGAILATSGNISTAAGAFNGTAAHTAGGILQGALSGTVVDGDKVIDLQTGHVRADYIDSAAAIELGADVLRLSYANSLYVATVPRTLPTCTSSLRGAMFYKEDTDTAGTAPAFCLCSRDNAALTYSYKVLSGTGTCP